MSEKTNNDGWIPVLGHVKFVAVELGECNQFSSNNGYILHHCMQCKNSFLQVNYYKNCSTKEDILDVSYHDKVVFSGRCNPFSKIIAKVDVMLPGPWEKDFARLRELALKVKKLRDEAKLMESCVSEADAALYLYRLNYKK